MKLISWNVNGLRACVGKGFLDFFREADADVVCLQETKLQPHQIELDLPGYRQYWNSAEKKGYSGTALFTRREPLQVTFGIGMAEHDTEGRVITAEYEDFFLVCCYTPNAQRGLTRLSYRMEWEDEFRAYLKGLDGKKPVILCGDLNVAHQEIDLKNPRSNRGNAGFSDEERAKMTELLSSGFTDTFRWLYPDVTGAYSWWSYMYHARDNNAGWRIDYFIVSDRLRERVADSRILSQVMGSDHCPVELELRDGETP
ncbi:MAG: exodeoxyribonuclease III [Clostridiales bacterium]|nr:exodeoxyribonuclease III [Clostridiales bacterium]MDY4181687.1 exodeoxyribonuclease III [Pseudoflavonifractor sp.]